MTIGAAIICIILTFMILFYGLSIGLNSYTRKVRNVSITLSVVIILFMWGGVFWYFNNTASGKRELVDQQSELNNGLNRTINIYTANGDLIATYTGKIDIEDNAGGYVIFDWNGKRYTYYNCFVESIADIE